MDNEKDKNLFEIRINENSKRLIHKTEPLVSISFVANVLLAIMMISVSIYSFIIQRIVGVDSIRGFYFFLYPIYTIIYIIIGTIAGYYYFLYTKTLKKAINSSDEDLFNSSFNYFYHNAILFTISMVMAFLFQIFQVVTIFV